MVPGSLSGDEILSDSDYRVERGDYGEDNGVERGGFGEIDESGNSCSGAVQL